jgi:hypothetical protein
MAAWPARGVAMAMAINFRPPPNGKRTTMPLHSKVAEDVELDLNPMCVREHSHEVPRFRIPPAGMLPTTALQVATPRT